MKNYFKSFFTIFLLLVFSISAFAKQKLTAEQIVEKHQNSIGSKEKLKETVNQVILCNLQLMVKGTPTIVQGQSVIASQGDKTIWGLNLNSNDYPLDRYSFNGKDTKVAFVTPGTRSILGEFIFNNTELIREGLLGGVLSNSWALLDVENKKPKLSYEGEKKIEGKNTYVLGFAPKNRSNLEIKMYFDKETFQHLRTDYNLVISASQAVSGNQSASQRSMGGVGGNSSEDRINSSAGQGSERYRITEDFSDFQQVNGITLPKSYKIFYSYFSDTTVRSAQKRNREIEWKFTVTNASFNQQLDPATFEIDTK